MVKKQQKTAAPKPAQGRRKDTGADSAKAAGAAGVADTPFAEQVKTSAQQIWSAGLAAFAKAQDQGTATVGKAEATLDATARRMSDLAGEVGSRAGQHWDKLESIFEDRVARALARLGMPAADEVAQLKARVEALSAEVAMLRASQTGVAPKPAAKASAKRPVTKAAPKPTPKPAPTPALKTAKVATVAKAAKTMKDSKAVKATKATTATTATKGGKRTT